MVLAKSEYFQGNKKTDLCPGGRTTGEDVLHRTPGHPARSPVIMGRVGEEVVDVALLGVVEEAMVAPLL